MILENIDSPEDVRALDYDQLVTLGEEIRTFIVDAVTRTGGHLGSNLGAVELTLALHRSFRSPNDILLWDTGHQAYVHKMITGRRDDFASLRQAGGLSGYPSRAESEHDWVENSHASTVLSYAHGFATAQALGTGPKRRVIPIIGDGALTGGMAFEGLNNLGHSGRDAIIVLNDNGRSYAPTISKLGSSLSKIRSNPVYMRRQARLERLLQDVPVVGDQLDRAMEASKAAIREIWEPPAFFENLGVRYMGPFDGHDVRAMERAFKNAAQFSGPTVVHVITQKGRGYAPAENDHVKLMHDVKRGWTANDAQGPAERETVPAKPRSYTEGFTDALIKAGEEHPNLVAITAAMPDSTGLLSFEERFPDRCFDVGIAEQHAVTAATGMAMGGLRPVIALYSTFLSRAFDQVNLDAALHGQPIVLCLDRAGITGDDGSSHHGVLDMVLLSKIPGMTMFAPSSYQEVGNMLDHAMTIDDGPVSIRWPKTPAPHVGPDQVGHGISARKVRSGSEVCLIGVGKMLGTMEEVADALLADGIEATVWDPRCIKPLDAEMLADATEHALVFTAEDGLKAGGIGEAIADAISGHRLQGPVPVVRPLGIPTQYLPHGNADDLLASVGLDATSIAAEVRTWREALSLV